MLFRQNIPLKTVQVLLGHSNIAIIAQIHTHVVHEDKQGAAEKIDKLFI